MLLHLFYYTFVCQLRGILTNDRGFLDRSCRIAPGTVPPQSGRIFYPFQKDCIVSRQFAANFCIFSTSIKPKIQCNLILMKNVIFSCNILGNVHAIWQHILGYSWQISLMAPVFKKILLLRKYVTFLRWILISNVTWQIYWIFLFFLFFMDYSSIKFMY